MVQPLFQPPATLRKTTRLRRMLETQTLSFLMEAHSGLSAKVVEEAGFAGIWGSGLSISAALGVRDNNEASWTQVLEVVEFMADATSIPILLDGDTGYGNFNSVRRLVGKLEQRGIAGVCLEDKLFPKTNSFLRGTSQPLADMDEFAGKIRAAKESQMDPDFVVVARVEALIAGLGLEEALKRAEAYRLAGADAILIHSAKKNPSEILAFKQEWGDRLPVVIVPTKYYTTPTNVFREAGMRIVIWANHLMRSSLTAMQDAAKKIHDDETLVGVEENVAPLAEVFRLQGEAELETAEKAYLPKPAAARGIVLAAGRGALGELVRDKPKCMVPMGDKPILAHVLDAHRAAGIRDLVVVRGFAKETVNLPGATYVDNDAHATTGELASLAAAADHIDGPCVISYGDVLLKRYVLEELLDAEGDFVVAVDSLSHAPFGPSAGSAGPQAAETGRRRAATKRDWASCSMRHSRKALLENVQLTNLSESHATQGVTGEWMGLLKLSANGARVVKELLVDRDGDVPDLIRRLVRAGHPVRVVYSRGGWLDVDTISDLLRGASFR